PSPSIKRVSNGLLTSYEAFTCFMVKLLDRQLEICQEPRTNILSKKQQSNSETSAAPNTYHLKPIALRSAAIILDTKSTKYLLATCANYQYHFFQLTPCKR
ncbi:MAG: hypothetical protein PHC50_09740, partial [Candidatus Cloacimonetes bacterium]|nr:hypothetical protein [Candidatus Cloacimonadota bacterium]